MTNLTYNLNFKKLCEKLCLGSLQDEPQQVFGGLLHRMYQIQTEKGCYAVKTLNPQIMQRKTAKQHFIFSENAARIAEDSGINALPAISVNGNSLHEIDDQYYLVFPWFNGKAMAQNSVDIDKCKIIGGLLSKIHNLDFSSISSTHENHITVNEINWNMYVEKAEARNLKWGSDFAKTQDTLYQIEKRANKAVQESSKNLVVSHRDLDPKNVLWDENGVPMIIDWEATGTVNPSLELLEVALYWSGGETSIPDKNAFCTVIDSYTKNGGTISGSVEDILYSVFKGKLEWLEYNMKRSLRIECSSDEEQELGTKEVVNTIHSILNYYKAIPVLLKWLSE